MGALPKRKPSTRRQGKRRATHTLKLPALVSCPKCNEPKRPHEVCPNCGYYKKKEVIKVKEKPKRKSK